MAGKLIILLGIAVFANPLLLAEPPSGNSDQPKAEGSADGKHEKNDKDGDRRKSKRDPKDREKFETVRKAIDALTPEQRKRFQENFLRWSNLSPEEKKALSDRDTFRRRKIAADVDAALKEAGLELDGDRREAFEKRYGEERHKIEEQLRKDMDEKRKPLVKEVIAKLKAEFASDATPGVTAPQPVSPCAAKP